MREIEIWLRIGFQDLVMKIRVLKYDMTGKTFFQVKTQLFLASIKKENYTRKWSLLRPFTWIYSSAIDIASSPSFLSPHLSYCGAAYPKVELKAHYHRPFFKYSYRIFSSCIRVVFFCNIYVNVNWT